MLGRFEKLFVIVALLTTAVPYGAAGGQRVPASAVQESSRALNVNGQVRNLSMLPSLKKEKDKLNFGSPRFSYKDKVPKTIF